MASPKRTRCHHNSIIRTISLFAVSSLALFQFYTSFFLAKQYGTTTIDEAKADRPQKLRGTQETPAKVSADQSDSVNQLTFTPVKAGTSPVTCDSTPCNGHFSYSPPNTDKANASITFKHAFDRYKYGSEGKKIPYGEQDEIFMPTKTDPRECVDEWKSSRPSWVDK